MLRLRNILLTFSCILFSIAAIAQQTFTISGVIRDEKETLPGAAVYLAGYKIATVTNHEGRFSIANLKPGNYDILVQMVGFLPLSKNITITNKSVTFDLKLTENTTMLREVVVKPDPNRAYYLGLFKKYFIGTSPNAEQCEIFNTNCLIIDEEKANRSFSVKATDLLVIENAALGYRIKYLLQYFEYSFETRILFYAGYPTYEEMKGSKAKQKKWAKNREAAYRGSALHFFKSLYQNNVYEEGFEINKRIKLDNPNRPPDSVINLHIKRLTSGKLQTNENSRSLADWYAKRREPKQIYMISRSPVKIDTLVKRHNDDLKMINFTDELFVIYKKERESATYHNSGNYIQRTKELEGHQVSVVQMFTTPIHFYASGLAADPRSMLYIGYWAYEKMADMVPVDYIPLK